MQKVATLLIFCAALLFSCGKPSDAPPANTDAKAAIFRVIANSSVKLHVLIVEVHSDNLTRDTLDLVTSDPAFNYGFVPSEGSLVNVNVTSPSASEFTCAIYYKGNKIGPGSIANTSSGAEADFVDFKITH